jgi:small subunit ribosomal protein S7
MSRRHSAEKREVNPDPKFGNIIITKFMNSIMYDGKKSVAEGIVYGALDIMIETKTKQRSARRVPAGARQRDADDRSALAPRRRRHLPGAGRSAHRAPPGAGHPLDHHGARERNEKTMTERLSAELLDASNNRGNAVKKREDTHRMAEANRAFSHYRW